MAGLFYYVLGNVRPELRSTLKAIQLIACVTCNNLNKYGFEKILNPFIENVNTLSEVRIYNINYIAECICIAYIGWNHCECKWHYN